jgi:flagellar biosynthesis protein FliQ
MDILQGIVGTVLTIVALVVMICLVAGLFMVIFGIATGIDDQIQS